MVAAPASVNTREELDFIRVVVVRASSYISTVDLEHELLQDPE